MTRHDQAHYEPRCPYCLITPANMVRHLSDAHGMELVPVPLWQVIAGGIVAAVIGCAFAILAAGMLSSA